MLRPSSSVLRPSSSVLRRWAPLLAVGALLGIAAAAAALSSPQVTHTPLPEPRLSARPPTGEDAVTLQPPQLRDAAGSPAALPAWLMNLALGLCLLVVIAIVLVVAWVLMRDTISVRKGALSVDGGVAGALRPRPEDVVAALDAGLSDLSDADRDPRRAVIACWLRLEQAAAVAGTPRQIGDTSTDLVLRLLSAHRVDRRVLDLFAHIYREARYATHVVDEDMRSQAQAALRRLRVQLTEARVAP